MFWGFCIVWYWAVLLTFHGCIVHPPSGPKCWKISNTSHSYKMQKPQKEDLHYSRTCLQILSSVPWTRVISCNFCCIVFLQSSQLGRHTGSQDLVLTDIIEVNTWTWTVMGCRWKLWCLNIKNCGIINVLYFYLWETVDCSW